MPKLTSNVAGYLAAQSGRRFILRVAGLVFAICVRMVKVNLGFIEIALAFTYLSQADLIWHWGLLDREIMIGLFISIFSLMGLYALGKLILPHESPIERLSVPRLLYATCIFWFVLYLVPYVKPFTGSCYRQGLLALRLLPHLRMTANGETQWLDL